MPFRISGQREPCTALPGNARSSKSSKSATVDSRRDSSGNFLAGFLFVSTGLAYDAFGTPRPDAYFQATESKAPVVSQRYEGKSQLDVRLK